MVGLEEKVGDIARVYPNPANEFVVIETNGNESDILEIYNGTGELCDKLTIKSNRTVINTAHLNRGIYFFRIVSNKHAITGKFLINR